MKRLLIIGGGESGVGAAILAKQKSWKVFVSDQGKICQDLKNELIDNEIRFEENGHSFDILKEIDLIVKSPGVPGSSPFIKDARNLQIRIISEIEFGFLHCPGRIIGITGSNGKTTTTLLTFHILCTAGVNVCLAGNVGTSFCRMIATDPPADWYVLEVSSFQLDDIETFRPDIAVILNISPDHLDRYHYDLVEYTKSKLRITQYQEKEDLLLINRHDNNIMKYLEVDRLDQRLMKIATSLNKNSELISSVGAVFQVKNPGLRGPHNLFNLNCAVEIGLELNIGPDMIQKAINTFRNAPHRMEIVASVNGVKFINDSKATNVESAFYALQTLEKPVIWIAGGQDKGNNYEPLKTVAGIKVKAMVCLGAENQKLISNFQGIITKIEEASSMKEAFDKSRKYMERGDCVLLSPACASFDLFNNYMDRGDQFRQEVFNSLRKD